MKKYAIALLLVFLFLPVLLLAGPSKIISISYDPPNPTYGDLVHVTIQLCEESAGDPRIAVAISTQATKQTAGMGGQIFVVDANGIDRDDVTFPNGGTDLGLHLGATGIAPAGQCKDCGNSDGWPATLTYDVHIPTADYFSGVCNPTSLYILVTETDYSFNVGNWSSIAACANGDFLSAQIPIVVPPPTNSLTIRYEGTLTAAGDEVLYSMDYSYGGSGAFSITDPVPGGGDFTVISYGPVSVPGGAVTGPAIGATTGTYVWTFPSRAATAGMQSGTVWMLLKLNNYTLNKVYTNTATTAQPGTTVKTASASVTSGQPAISISKTESAASLMAGSNITYVLSYDINGYVLQNFQPFDNIANGTYNSGTGAPAGWKFQPYNGDPGTWTIHDPCNTGGSYITASGAATTYPGLLLGSGAADPTNQFCQGMIVSDFYIEDSSYSGADAQVLIRSNGLTGTAGRSIGLSVSIDDNPAVLYLSLCGGTSPAPFCGAKGPAGSFSDLPQIGLISSKKWYRMRILASCAAGGEEIRARVWARGDPEPGAWDIDYTVPGLCTNLDWACDGTGTSNDWRPGVNQQTGDGASVQDSYDNFTVYTARVTAASTTIYDTIPAGLTYAGNPGGGCTMAGGVLNCAIGAVSLTSGSFTWFGTANACNSTLTNQAFIMYSAGSPPMASNLVSADVMCWSPTFTPTATPFMPNTNTPTPTVTGTITSVITMTHTLTPVNPTATCQLIIDDCEDGNDTNLLGGKWYTYDDSSNSGTSVVSPGPLQVFYMQAPGLGSSAYAARISGYVTTSYAYGYIGMGTQIPAAYSNFNNYTGIRFSVKIDSNTYRIRLVSGAPQFLQGTGDNMYEYQFSSPDTSLVYFDVPFSVFTQEAGWGSTVTETAALANITDIQFQTVGQPLGSIDFWVDNIELYGCPGTATAVPTATVTRTGIIPGTATFTPTFTPTAVMTAAACGGTEGRDWTAATTNAAFPARYLHGCVAYDNGTGEKLWVFGGANAVYPHFSDIWSSSDGANWTEAAATAAFGQRASFSTYIHNGKVWLAGGDINGTTMNDVWSTTDMINWTRVTPAAAFPPRGLATSILFDAGSGERMWIMGGDPVTTDFTGLNDVWSSADGITWTQATASAAFAGRYGAGGTVYNGKMWISGGMGASLTCTNDVWSSSDGVNWTEVTAHAAFAPRHEHTMIVYDNKMWVIGGTIAAQAYLFTDAWWSTDGITWNAATMNTPMVDSAAGSAIFNSQLWITGGSIQNDAWYTCGNPPATLSPTPTFTLTMAPSIMPSATVTSTILPAITPTYTPVMCAGTGCVNWTAATLNAAFPGRHEQASLVFGGKMWVITGAGSVYPHYRDAWWSADGADWYAATLNTAFAGRAYPGKVVYNDGTGAKMWIAAGNSNGTNVNDVWYSSNGADWTMATGNAAFAPRTGAAMVSYNGRMWLIGGGLNSSGPPYGHTNEVWWSTDGVDWTLATSNAAFSPRSAPGCVVFNDGTGDKMWIIGGGTQNDDNHRVNDVWYSSDGVDWTLATGNAGFGGRSNMAAVVYNNEIMVACGFGSGTSTMYNDVWTSPDGVHWFECIAGGPFAGRDTEGLVFNGEAWLLAGYDNNNAYKDVWYTCGSQFGATPAGTPTQVYTAPSATPTITPAPVPAGTPCFRVALDHSTAGSSFITISITSSQMLTGPVGVTVYVNGENGAAPVFYYTATQSPANPLVYTVQYPKQAGLGDITRIVVTGTDASGTAVSDGSFDRQPEGPGNVYLYRNVFDPGKGERCGVVFRHGGGDKIRARIYNKNAVCIKELVKETTGPAGTRQAYWDGTNDEGREVVSGVYMMLIETSTYTITKKVGVVH